MNTKIKKKGQKMNNQDKSKIFVKITAGVLAGIIILAGAGTLIYYLIRG